MSGRLITVEGGEGAGKSTVLNALRACIEQVHLPILITREPGGTALGEAVRKLVLEPSLPSLCAESELLLMFAARAQLVREVIRPALAAGIWVLSDRFTDASFAYQGGGRGQPVERIIELERWAADELKPDLTLLLDLPVAQGLERVKTRGACDRMESESNVFFERVRAAYRARASVEPQRFRIIDASRAVDQVREDACLVLRAFIASNAAGVQ